jgi:hypothetical protein
MEGVCRSLLISIVAGLKLSEVEPLGCFQWSRLTARVMAYYGGSFSYAHIAKMKDGLKNQS